MENLTFPCKVYQRHRNCSFEAAEAWYTQQAFQLEIVDLLQGRRGILNILFSLGDEFRCFSYDLSVTGTRPFTSIRLSIHTSAAAAS